MSLCLLAAAFILAKQGAVLVQSEKAAREKICIVVDAGHGGSDPGKVGINGALEKDINLSIALKLKDLLEQREISVVLTRDSDAGLSPADATNKKAADMQKRCQIIADANPAFTVSIHQNSYTPEHQKRPGILLRAVRKRQALSGRSPGASDFQVDPQNTRVAKANESYYLLKNTHTYGNRRMWVLNNKAEPDLLLTEDYQSKLAHAIYLGILSYLEEESLL